MGAAYIDFSDNATLLSMSCECARVASADGSDAGQRGRDGGHRQLRGSGLSSITKRREFLDLLVDFEAYRPFDGVILILNLGLCGNRPAS